VLDITLKLDYTDGAKSLKRARAERSKVRILVAVLGFSCKMSRLAGYSVDTVETDKEAIGFVRKRECNFVFTDLMMPEMDDQAWEALSREFLLVRQAL
jgi:CheY-like chemotaxis protein